MPSHAFDDARATSRRETVPAQRRPILARAPYSPWEAAEEMGLHIRYAPLRDSWAWWVPSRCLIIVADQLTHVEERCALAHEIEHARSNDDECSHSTALGRLCARRQEIRADEGAARKLIPVVDLEAVLRWATSPEEAAQELNVTEHMLRVRLRIRRRELECLDTLRIAG
ncbi:ImmA/IrrE family metallo-endopeptidase [Streptomyces yunnanensis]|uniref:ImmA/IrrE family metallo-endopeptidase n=1 Tax=Streptomyces yunnanensis TaxID=156453 RepID=A0ABY8AD04_9ACTN|nr:ImmA/IrrE family metallo-endopeptidase [Streptomyces yunnanensis]WEB41537.1 ImmA/IrrE family metallo-endopeptidase [Streptomyces yunnanensis]